MTDTFTITQNGATMSVTVVIPDADVEYYSEYQWDSKLGLVTALRNGKRVIVPHTGINQTGTLDPTQTFTTSNNIIRVDRDYLYY